LNYYQEALKLYLKKSGDSADPKKIAMLEKNIALAFYNKGLMAEAVKHFDKALQYFGEKISKSKIVQMSKFLLTLFLLLKTIYWPSKKAKKAPGDKDILFFDLVYKKALALLGIDSKRFFMEASGMFVKLNKFDLKGMKGGGGLYAAYSMLFYGTGLSFSISQKILMASEKLMAKNDVKSLLMLRTNEGIHNYLAGQWNEEYRINEDLTNAYMQLGEMVYGYGYLGYSCAIAVGRGDFTYAAMIVKKMSSIADAYDYDFGKFCEYSYEAFYCLNKRKLYDTATFVDKSIYLANKLGIKLFHLRVLGMQAKALILLKELTGAEISLRQAQQILLEAGRVAPMYSKEYFSSQFLFDVYEFEALLSAEPSRKDKSKTKKLKKRAHKSGKDAVRLFHKVAEKKPEALRLMGTLYWLENKQNKALKYWDKSIRSGEHLGARPELARTYMEVGNRLLEKKSKHRELNGISAEAHLEKARTLFQEMELQWDLEELEKVERGA